MYRSEMLVKIGVPVILLIVLLYGVIGTPTRVAEIKARAPEAIEQRGWEILRYEGWQYGSFATHGGKVWYHVANSDNKNIQYRVSITLWNDELHFNYGKPEELHRFTVNYN